MREMHEYYGITGVVEGFDSDNLTEFVKFRSLQIQEEVDEFKEALENSDAEEMVDALIDMCVFAIGTLDLLEVDSNEAWNKILEANMSKKVGIKEGRPNPLGLPDLMKPDGWKAPDHLGNHGRFIYVNYTSSSPWSSSI
jgi:predicted HAD superfamily Cof-like phosphohydrolase